MEQNFRSFLSEKKNIFILAAIIIVVLFLARTVRFTLTQIFLLCITLLFIYWYLKYYYQPTVPKRFDDDYQKFIDDTAEMNNLNEGEYQLFLINNKRFLEVYQDLMKNRDQEYYSYRYEDLVNYSNASIENIKTITSNHRFNEDYVARLTKLNNEFLDKAAQNYDVSRSAPNVYTKDIDKDVMTRELNSRPNAFSFL